MKIDYSELSEIINDVSLTFVKVAKEYLDDELVGIYFYGSAFTNDFFQNSDLDFIVILNFIEDYHYNIVKKIHDTICEISQYGKRLEGGYYTINSKSPWESQKCVWVDQDNSVEICSMSIEPDSVSAIRCYGMTAYGKEPQYVFPFVSEEMMVTFEKKYILSATEKIKNKVAHPDRIWATLLNVCRSLYYITNRSHTTKTKSCLWAIKKYHQHVDVLKKALSIHQDVLSDVYIDESLMNKIFLFIKDVRSTHNVSKCVGLNMPMRTEIQLTNRCDCRCPHCGYYLNTKFLDLSDFLYKNFLAELKDYWGWIDRVLLEGGEPLCVYRNLLDSVNFAESLNINNIQINSNLINASKLELDTLVSSGCNYIEVSVDALSYHNWLVMRGLKESEKTKAKYNKFINNLEYICHKPGVIVDFNFTLTKLNICELADVYKYACYNGARYVSVQNLVNSKKEILELETVISEIDSQILKCIDCATGFSFPTSLLFCCFESIGMPDFSEKFNHFIIEKFTCSFGKQYLYMDRNCTLRTCCFGRGNNIGKYSMGELNNIISESHNIITSCPTVDNK